MVDIRLRHRKISTFDVAVIGSQIQRSPIAFVGKVHIRAAFDEIFGKLVMTIVGGRQQWGPVVLADLINVSSSIEEQFRRVKVAFPCRKNQRRQAAATRSAKTG